MLQAYMLRWQFKACCYSQGGLLLTEDLNHNVSCLLLLQLRTQELKNFRCFITDLKMLTDAGEADTQCSQLVLYDI